jgi:basic membrane protein A
MNKKTFLFGLLLIALVVAGCTAAPSQEEAAIKPLRIAAVLPGRIDDGMFNQQMYEGLLTLQKYFADQGYQVEIAYVEGVYEVVDIEPALRDYAEQGYDLIIGHGFQYQDPIIAVAPDFPEVNFAIGPGSYIQTENVVTYDADNSELGYALGTAAGLATKTNFIASVSGIVAMNHGFEAGARAINPDIEFTVIYVGNFEDMEGAREATTSLIDQGADVIYGIMNNPAGIMEVTESKGVYGTVNADASISYPKSMLANVETNYWVAIKQMVDDIRAGSFGNKSYAATFRNDGLIAKLHQPLTDSAQDEFDAVIEGLIDGSIVVPEPE